MQYFTAVKVHVLLFRDWSPFLLMFFGEHNLLVTSTVRVEAYIPTKRQYSPRIPAVIFARWRNFSVYKVGRFLND